MVQVVCQKDSDLRESDRSNVFLNATLDVSGVTSAVRVRNISVSGALLEGEQLPSHGIVVRLRRGQLEASGEIAWESGNYRGLQFTSPVDVPTWVKRVGHCGQQEVDRRLAVLRQSGQSNATHLLADDPSGKDSLHRISSDLDQVCEQLAASAQMSIELGEYLIRLDTIAQRLRGIASTDRPNLT